MLIDCLIHLESSSTDKNELIILCKQQYQNNPYELNMIEEFDKNYSPERSLWWYTRHSFLYRLLNKALKIENINLLSLFRFFIHDIKQQLEKNKSLSSVRVYRGLFMSKEELEILMKFIGNFISINKFLSTSHNREHTRAFLSSTILSEDMEKVFLEINANPRLENNKTFSNITSYSYFPNREEVLFMIGSIFRLVHIDRDIDGIWNIQLILSSNKDHQLQSIIQQKKNELDIVDTDILSFGFVLEDMGKFDEAEKYYHYVLNQLLKDQEDETRCYHALGEITQKKGDYDSSLKWYQQSLEKDIQMSKIDDPNMAISYNSLAVMYSKKRDFTLALESYQKALEIWKTTLGEDHPDIAMCYNNIGIVYQEEQNYSEALEYYHKAWNIRQKYLPAEHPSLGQTHTCIGNIHYQLDHYDLALEHYNLALEIFRKSLLPYHADIAMVLRNIGLVYQGKGEFQQALSCLKQALTIYRHSLSVTHPDMIQIEQIIRRISTKL
jgi:tetratricopeptide (TPR) repeat protein